ncbi:interleukin-3 receptor subunit alpha [Heterocephalus glaber]|uniref:Interleukin-3 receptor subunit alpha n=1 Tax=Heterocephalus glaber TaxID=10181 RepID=A0AAX6RW64_HETGA|nr:interleukin-3 receptor subunit alpha [Heterocephalus glaber]
MSACARRDAPFLSEGTEASPQDDLTFKTDRTAPCNAPSCVCIRSDLPRRSRFVRGRGPDEKDFDFKTSPACPGWAWEGQITNHSGPSAFTVAVTPGRVSQGGETGSQIGASLGRKEFPVSNREALRWDRIGTGLSCDPRASRVWSDSTMPGPWLSPPLLLLLLPPACCPRPAAPELGVPIGNLRVEPGSRRLTWDLLGNASGIECFKDGSTCLMVKRVPSTQPGLHPGGRKSGSEPLGPTADPAAGSDQAYDKYCHYSTMSLCTVTNYTVKVTQPAFSAWILFPESGSNAEAAARDLKCKIFDGGPMVCSWAVGTGAPGDVQYQLSWRNLESEEEGVCLRYNTDAQGRNIRCQFDQVRALPEFMMITVNGRSNGFRVPCTDLSIELAAIAETLLPPNISTECNRTHVHLSWLPPRSHFRNNFKYELQTEQIPGGSPVPVNSLSTNEFLLPNPGRCTVRIRARYRSNRWTAWSPPQAFGCDREESSQQQRLWPASVLAALGTLLLAAAALLLCRRALLGRLLPPLPPMKDPLADAPQRAQLMPWEAGLEDCPVSELQVLRRE